MRKQGTGRGLIEAAERWALSQGCKEMASDAVASNAVSIAAHRKLGFEVQWRWSGFASGSALPPPPR